MNYTVCMPTRASLRPNAHAARRLAQLLRELHASQEVIEVADKVADESEKAEDKPANRQRELVSR